MSESTQQRDWKDKTGDALLGAGVGFVIGGLFSLSFLSLNPAPPIMCAIIGGIRGATGGKESIGEMINDARGVDYSTNMKTSEASLKSLNKSSEEWSQRHTDRQNQHNNYMNYMYNQRR